MNTAVELTSVADAADALDHAHQQLIACEVAEALSIAALCDLHAIDETIALEGMERWVTGGAAGTPQIGEFIAADIAVLLGVSIGSAFGRIADILNLRHRHPTLWAAFLDGDIRFWEGSTVARAASSAGLDEAACARFDQMCATALRIQPWQRVRSQVDRWIIQADPAAAAERAARAAERRHVTVGAIEDGQTDLWGQLDAADGIALDQALNHIAEHLAGDTHDHRRATALGALARSVLGQDTLNIDDPAGESSDGSPVALPNGAYDDALPNGAYDDALPDESPNAALPNAAPADAGHTIGSVLGSDDPRRTGSVIGTATLTTPAVAELPTCTCHPGRTAELVVRIDATDLADPATGVIDIDNWGRLLLPRLNELLTGCAVTVRPVIVGAEVEPTDSYRVPNAMRLALEVRNPVDVFPYGSTPARRCETDHTITFRHHDRVGRKQTGMGNLGPLSKFTHRVKTFGGWRTTQPRPGSYLWRSRLGYEFLVTPAGTIRIRRPRRAHGHRIRLSLGDDPPG